MMPAPDSRQADQQLWRFYHGRSMLAVFRPGDYLVIEPAALEQIRLGDVIVFRKPGADEEHDAVVHRVIARAPGSLLTCGDSNRLPDAAPVSAQNLLGRVVALERRGWRWPVLGGWAGLGLARLLRLRQRLARAGQRGLFWLAGWFYRWLRRSRLVRRWWRPAVRRVQYAAQDGVVIKYLHGRRVVARWWPGARRFECLRPYDLILSKPDPESRS